MKRSHGAKEPGRPSSLSISPRLESRWKMWVEAVPADGNSVLKLLSGAGKNARAARRKAGMDITWVTDRIAVGGGIWNADNMATVSRVGITHIIDMQIEFDDTPLAGPHGIAV